MAKTAARVLLLFCLLAGLCSFFLPGLIKHLAQSTARDQNIDLRLDIRRFGLFGIDFGKIHVGNGLEADALQLDFTPWGLVLGQIETIRISNLNIRPEIQNGTIVLPGLPAARHASENQSGGFFFPKIRTLACTGSCSLPGKPLTLPFQLSGTTNSHGFFNATLQLPEAKLAVYVHGDMNSNRTNATISVPEYDLQNLQTWLPYPAQGFLSARLNAIIVPHQTLQFQSSLEIRDVRTHLAGTEFAQNGTTRFSWNSGSEPTLSSVRLSAPLPLELQVENCTYSPDFFSANLAIVLSDSPLGLDTLHSSLLLNRNATATTANLRILPLSFRKDELTVMCKALELTVQNTDGSLHGEVNAQASIAHPGASIRNIDLKLPWAWPKPAAAAAGHFNADLTIAGKSVATTETTLQQNGTQLLADGVISLLPLGCTGKIRGMYDINDPTAANLQFTVPQQSVLLQNLRALNPALAALNGTGSLALQAVYRQGRMPGSIHVRSPQAGYKPADLDISGLQLDCTFPDLLNLHSAPAQRLAIDAIRMGKLRFADADVRFQLERRTIFIEGAVMRWAGGRIGSTAFRIDPQQQDLNVELFCDRVHLPLVFEQFGLQQAQGNGTAYGRLPLRYRAGSLHFDEGFLYSTPGENGALQLNSADLLTAGIPQGTPQFAQLDLAAEALKDFSYDWARLRLDTQGDDLLLSLQMDGKPNAPLPFVFQKDIGGFIRIHGQAEGSKFQGIRLDVNFRLPLERILAYRNLIEAIKNGG